MDKTRETMRVPALKLSSACVGYGKKRILGPVDLQVPAGKITTLIGPNGAGKSTLLKSITGELPLLSGRIDLFGRDLRSFTQHEAARRMAAVLTERIHPELLTCRDIVAVGRYPYTGAFGMLSEDDERKVDRALRDVHAEDIAERDFMQISDGQKQRILLARALCQEPELLILDEPTSYLDIKYKLDLLAVLQDMTRTRGMTVFMSLHEIDLAQKVSDLVVCVGENQVLLAGTPEEVFHKETMQRLYGMQNGYYDALFGTVEFSAGASGREQGQKEDWPEVVVLSMGGTGIPVYRRLQKSGISFSGGLLSESDADYHLARETGVKTAVVPAFQPADGEQVRQALMVIDHAGCVIDAGVPEGMHASPALQKLREYAQHRGICLSPDEFYRLQEQGEFSSAAPPGEEQEVSRKAKESENG